MKTTPAELLHRLTALEGHRGMLECRAIEDCLALQGVVRRLEHQRDQLHARNTELVIITSDQQRTIDALRRCEESLRAERDAFVAQLTIAKQETANALHALRSAVILLQHVADSGCDKELLAIVENVHHWLNTHAQQTIAPIPDPMP